MKTYYYYCVKKFAYGYSPDGFVFFKNNLYKVEIDYEIKQITLFNNDGRWVKFYIDSGFHTEKFIPNFIEQSKIRKEKLDKIYESSL